MSVGQDIHSGVVGYNNQNVKIKNIAKQWNMKKGWGKEFSSMLMVVAAVYCCRSDDQVGTY